MRGDGADRSVSHGVEQIVSMTSPGPITFDARFVDGSGIIAS